MNAKTSIAPNPKMQAAVEELEALILRCYPNTEFRLGRDPEGSNAVHLTAIVDVDEPDEVLDLVLDRVVELLIEDALPIVVIPVRTPERRAAMLDAASREIPRAMPPANDVHEKIRRWLAQEGWSVRDVDDPRSSFNVMVALKGTPGINIFQLHDHVDHITLSEHWVYPGDVRLLLGRLSDEQLREVVWNIYRDVSMMGIEFLGFDTPSTEMTLRSYVYFDGLTKDALVQRILMTIRGIMLAGRALVRALEGQGHAVVQEPTVEDTSMTRVPEEERRVYSRDELREIMRPTPQTDPMTAAS